MEDRERPRMRKYGESKTTRIMMTTVPHVTSGSGLRQFQADGFLFDSVQRWTYFIIVAIFVYIPNNINTFIYIAPVRI